MDRSEIAALKADLRRMQSRIDELETAGEEPTNRRNMLRGLGAAAAGAAVGGLAFARPAGATDGNTLIIGNTQTAQSPTHLVATASYSYSDNVGLLHLTDDDSQTNILSGATCLTIVATNTLMSNGAAISATSQALKLSAPTPLKMNDGGLPTQSSGTRGQFKHQAGELWFCVTSSGSQRWRRIAGPTGAGGFNAVTPFRAYDSRAANPAGNVGILTSGNSRTISIADTRDNSGVVTQTNTVPLGAIAVTANVTVTGTTGVGGFLSINPGGNTSQATSAINWFGAGQNLANGLTLTLGGDRQLTVVCGSGTGSDTHFIVDITGYYI